MTESLSRDVLPPGQEDLQADVIKQWRLADFRRRFYRLLMGLAVVGLLLSGLSPFAQLAWKATDSLPGYVFILNKTIHPKQGELAAFWAPANPYYPKELWFTKYIRGVEGDVISHKGRDVYLNGQFVGTALERDSGRGRPLAMTPDGVIPHGYYFMWTPHPHSYDSRYSDIGLISDDKIRGRVYRLF